MGKKTITISLSEDGVEKAIVELKEYKEDFNQRMTLLREKIAERIEELAQSGFSGAIVDDIISSNGNPRSAEVKVTHHDKSDTVTVVIAESLDDKKMDAIWVEFGAGVYYNGSPGSSPHPKGNTLGMTIGGYGEGYGVREVWGYKEDDILYLTHGTPAVMPMSQAASEVINDLYSIAKEVFR